MHIPPWDICRVWNITWINQLNLKWNLIDFHFAWIENPKFLHKMKLFPIKIVKTPKKIQNKISISICAAFSYKIYSLWTPNFTVVHITDRPTDRRQCVCDGWWRCRITINMMRVRLSVLVDFQMKKGSTVAYSVGLHTAYNSRIRMAFTCAVSYRLVLSLF